MDETLFNGDRAGRFVRTAWYERGIEHGNPGFDGRFRVNAPEAVLDPAFMTRSEVRENGMMLVRITEDLAQVEAAALYVELWGGHPGTAHKRVTINGRSTYALPEVGTAAGHCTYSYPALPLRRTDLVNGYNALQFACDQGASFWGHYIVDNAALRVTLADGHPDLAAAGLAGFAASVRVEPAPDAPETLRLRLACPPAHAGAIAAVDFWGHYAGYDENGNGTGHDWHGFTKARAPQAILGTATAPPFAISWNTAMLPAQSDVAVGAVVRFAQHPALAYVTAPARGSVAPREGSRVTLCPAEAMPAPFWSRAGEARTCEIHLACDPAQVERAELHAVIWDGGRGTVEAPFTLNGHPLPVAGAGHHDVLYRRLPVDPSLLRPGRNVVRVLSDTEHHGIEVLLPGPALVVRWNV